MSGSYARSAASGGVGSVGAMGVAVALSGVGLGSRVGASCVGVAGTSVGVAGASVGVAGACVGATVGAVVAAGGVAWLPQPLSAAIKIAAAKKPANH